MAYSICYMQGSAQRRELYDSGRTGRGRRILYLCAALLAVWIIGMSVAGKVDFLIPGDREVTKAAFGEMVSTLEEGEDVKTAITAFCREVIAGADAKNSTNKS